MSSPSGLYLFAWLGFAAVILQLPTRLIELLDAAGPFVAEYVDHLLRQEELRSVLEPTYHTLRTRYNEQRQALANLSQEISKVCTEHNRRCREFWTEFQLRVQPRILSAKYQDTEWSEPHTLVKMFYATDLKAVFLCAKVKQLRLVVPDNEARLRRGFSTLADEKKALSDFIVKIGKDKKRLRLEAAKLSRQARWERILFSHRTNTTATQPWFLQEQRLRGPAPLPDLPRPVRRELPELPLHAAARAARENPVPYHPFVVDIPAPGTGFEALQFRPRQVAPVQPAPEPSFLQQAVLGSGYEALQLYQPSRLALVPVSAPALEPSLLQQTRLSAPVLIGVDDSLMLEAPAVSWEVTNPLTDMAIVVAAPPEEDRDIEMLDAPPYEPLICQGSSVSALPAPPLFTSPAPTVPADAAVEMEEEEEHSVFSPFAPPASALAHAQAPADSGSDLAIDPRLFIANFSPLVEEQRAPTPGPAVSFPLLPEPQQQQQQEQEQQQSSEIVSSVFDFQAAPSSVPAPPQVLAPVPASQPDSISFDFEDREPQSRRIAKPRSRLGRRQGQSSAAALANAPVPVAAAAPSAPIFSAPQPTPSTSATNGQGNASMSSDEAEPNAPQEIVDGRMPGEYLRTLCQDWIVACSLFMSQSDLCTNLSKRWIRDWSQSSLINLGEDMDEEVDELEYDADEAAQHVRLFFRYNLTRTAGGPSNVAINAMLRNVKDLAANEGLDLGKVEMDLG